MSVRLHHADDTERLAEALWSVVGRDPRRPRPVAGPGSAETIIVQSKGMARWLQLRMAETFGVCANVDFRFPRRFLEDALDEILGKATRSRHFEKERMVWALAGLLPGLMDDPAFAPLKRYTQRDDELGDGMRMQLAQKIATVFDDYLVYRPDLLRDWELSSEAEPGSALRGGHGEDPEEAWQSQLWRTLVSECCGNDGQHLARRIADLQDRALDKGAHPRLPVRVSVFGVSAMPRAFIEAFASLSRALEVHFFVLGPSPAVWGRARSRTPDIQGLLAKGAGPDALADLLGRPDGSGNALLASSGRMAREFESLVLATARPHASSEGAGVEASSLMEEFGDPDEGREARSESDLAPSGPTTLLATLQADIRADRRRGPGDAGLPPVAFDPADPSIRLHSCHGPMREVEVLRDQLLALFEDASLALRPRDVIVMVPEIDRYAPYVEAVFGRPPGDPSSIPYGIADREVGATHLLFSALERALETLRGRMTATDIVELLAIDAVGARFGIAEGDLPALRHWVNEAGIRWGADAEHRRAAGQPAMDQNTWRLGLERLLLGYSLPDAVDAPYRGLLPAAAAEGGEAELIGRLAQAGEALFGLQRLVKGRKTVADWRDALQRVIETLLDKGWQRSALRRQLLRALGSVERNAVEEGYALAVDLDTILAQMGRHLHDDAPPHGFLAGGVTFCALAPMRAIPFQVVCLLGMSEGAFPRIQRRAGFDLLEKQARVGDPDLRDGDRHLFLEALLAARERLIISFEGQSARDGRSLPPSVLVAELLDLIADSADFGSLEPEDGIGSSESGDGSAGDRLALVRRALVIEHPSQPFSRRYFDAGPRLYSYSRRFSGLGDGGDGPSPRPFFDEAGLPERGPDPAEPLSVSIADLRRFLLHPSRFLLRSLGLYLEREAAGLEDREPMSLDALSRWHIGDAWLRGLIRGLPAASAMERARQSGRLPLGTVGEIDLGDLEPVVGRLEAAARPYLDEEAFDRRIDLVLDGDRLEGRLEGLRRGAALTIRFGKLRPRDELALWLRHLILCAAEARPTDGPPLPTESVLIAEDGKAGVLEYGLGPIPRDRARKLLGDLLSLYEIGASRPLPFFPKASKPYAERMHKRDDRGAALAAVGEKWAGGRYDASDPYLRRAFGDFDPARGASLLRGAGAGSTAARADLALLEGELGFEALARRIFDPLLEVREARA